jgi:putative endonuclease
MTPELQPKDDWLVYLARCADGSLYTGITNDLEARLAAHNSGKGAAYTRGRLPIVMVFTEMAGTRSAALRREAEIKSLSRPEKLRLVRNKKRG